MNLLGLKLKDEFFEVTGGSVSPGSDFFTVNLKSGTKPVNIVVKELDAYLKSYIKRNGNPNTPYQFTILNDGHLVIILRYNDPAYGYNVKLLAEGKLQRLFVVDMIGASGELTVFNDDFKVLGSMRVKEPNHKPHPDFNDQSLWDAKGELVEIYLNQILGQISFQLNTHSRL